MHKRRGLCVMALFCLVLMAGCGKSGSSGSGGAGGAASNAGTVQAIQDRIRADKELAGADIKVHEQGGAIVLDGTVATIAQKDKAEQIVLATQKEKNQQPGVLNNLMVKEDTGNLKR